MNSAPQNSAIPCDAAATRASLIARIRNWSDDSSWQEFFQTYWRLIYALAVRSGLSESEAEEVVQSTVIAVAKNIGEFNYDPNKGSFRQWLIHQAQWRIADFQRKRQREQKLFVRSGHRDDEGASDETATAHRVPNPRCAHETKWECEWNDSVHVAALDALRSQLNPKHYQVFDLYVLRHWPSERVRRTLGIGIAQMHLINSRVKHLYRRERASIERTLAKQPKAGSSLPKKKL